MGIKEQLRDEAYNKDLFEYYQKNFDLSKCSSCKKKNLKIKGVKFAMADMFICFLVKR